MTMLLCLRRVKNMTTLTSNLFFCGLAVASSSFAAECKPTTPAAYAKLIDSWHGRTLIASASWCSSCKSKLLEAHKNPHGFVILVAFDEIPAMEKVLRKFDISSPCIAGDDLVKELKIDALPWQAKI